MSREWFVRRAGWLVLVAASVVATSCGNDREKCHPAHGRVTLDDAPLAGAEIWLFPDDEGFAKRNPPIRPFAKSDKDGKLAFMTYVSGDGAPAGQYKARVICERKVKGEKSLDDEREATRNILPAKYADPSTSSIAVAVEAGDNALPVFELKK